MTSTNDIRKGAAQRPAEDSGPAAAPPSATRRAPARRRRRWPRITALALVVGLLVGAAVYAVAALMPPSYEGRVGLLALPTESSGSALLNQSGVSTSYGEVVGLAMPSIGDLVTSPKLLEAVASTVPGSPPADELGGDIGVELLAGSGVARVSVTSDDPQLAGRLAEAVADQVIKADLLAPAGTLRTLDAQATVLQRSPDTTLGAGLALVAGLLAAGVTVLVMRPFRARVGPARAAQEAVTASGRRPATLLDADDPALLDRAKVLVRASGRPVRVVGASPGVEDAVLALQSDLAGEPSGQDRSEAGEPAVLVLVDRTAVRRTDVDDALGALPPAAPVLAVVVV